MIALELESTTLERLAEAFGTRLQREIPLARFTAARLGGPAEALIEVHTIEELIQAVELGWQENIPLTVLGGGSNVLVSDVGVHGLVVINRARDVRFESEEEPPFVWAESGANFGLLARQAAQHGLSGLEWAAGIPGTLGGAVVGNAGAHGQDMAATLRLAEILHHIRTERDAAVRREVWRVEKLDYSYRSSILKRDPDDAVVLAAELVLKRSTVQEVQKRIDDLVNYRRRTQPPGASMGSMFKNPPGDYAGRLIEAAGLKGYRIGDAQISSLHANFFINLGNASAREIHELIDRARKTVEDKFGVRLELEVELLGEW
jgi:UDP-N-acetylmuramate dehydrogenase